MINVIIFFLFLLFFERHSHKIVNVGLRVTTTNSNNNTRLGSLSHFLCSNLLLFYFVRSKLKGFIHFTSTLIEKKHEFDLHNTSHSQFTVIDNFTSREEYFFFSSLFDWSEKLLFYFPEPGNYCLHVVREKKLYKLRGGSPNINKKKENLYFHTLSIRLSHFYRFRFLVHSAELMFIFGCCTDNEWMNECDESKRKIKSAQQTRRQMIIFFLSLNKQALHTPHTTRWG